MKASAKELRKAAPQMLAFLESINHKTQLTPDDHVEINRLITLATYTGAAVIPLIKSNHKAVWDAFDDFYVHEFQTGYVYSKIDARKFQEITAFLEKKVQEAGLMPEDPKNQQLLIGGFRKMLEVAAKDSYIKRVFRPAIIAQNMPNIYIAAKNRQQLITAPSLADKIAAHY
jgi:hypothetical protein